MTVLKSSMAPSSGNNVNTLNNNGTAHGHAGLVFTAD